MDSRTNEVSVVAKRSLHLEILTVSVEDLEGVSQENRSARGVEAGLNLSPLVVVVVVQSIMMEKMRVRRVRRR